MFYYSKAVYIYICVCVLLLFPTKMNLLYVLLSCNGKLIFYHFGTDNSNSQCH